MGLFARFYHLGTKFFWMDESATALHLAGLSQEPFKVAAASDSHLTAAKVMEKFQRLQPDKGIVEVVDSLAHGDPKHPPLYYALLYGWARMFGDSTAALRCFSAVIGTLCVPLMFWMCIELFRDRRVAWMTTVLFAVSPIFVLYSQEAREYILWIACVLLSSTLLLRALRAPGPLRWSLYGAALLLGLASHTLMLIVLVAHALYVCGCAAESSDKLDAADPSNLEPGGAPAVLKGYFLSSALALLVYAPWGALIIQQRWSGRSGLSWINGSIPISKLILHWIRNTGAAFIDFNGPGRLGGIPIEQGSIARYLVGTLLLLLMGYALWTLCRRTPRRVWLFILLLAGLFSLPMWALDLLKGGIRTQVPRYTLPLSLAAIAAVGWMLAMQTQSEGRKNRWAWRGLTGLLLAGGLLSLAASAGADTWWSKGTAETIAAAQTIRRSPRPLVMGSLQGDRATKLLSLCHRLPGDTPLKVVLSPTDLPPMGSAADRDVYFIRPSPQQRQRLRSDQFALSLIDPGADLWRITAAPLDPPYAAVGMRP
jgi:uncharacterized membrane protein